MATKFENLLNSNNKQPVETQEPVATQEPVFYDTNHINNVKLKKHTQAIIDLQNANTRNNFAIAVHLKVIRDEELFIDDGYTDVFDYAKKILDFSKVYVYKNIVNAEKFIEVKKIGKNTIYTSNLPHDKKDFTSGQLIELQGLEYDTAKKLVEDGIINSDMTTKEIRNIVKEHKPAKKKNTKLTGSMIQNIEDTALKTDTEIIEGDEKKQKEKLHNSYLKDIDKLYDIYEKLQKNPLLDTDEGKTALNRLLEAIESMNY